MATQTKKSAFDKLSAVNVYDKVEKKGQLTYLSWAHAWAFAKKLYPELTRKVYESENGMNYFTDGKTAWVKVGVTIDELECIDYLPVMNTSGRPKVIAWMIDNKELGMPGIIKILSQKYKIDPVVIDELSKFIKS